jgi:hypothetical protein
MLRDMQRQTHNPSPTAYAERLLIDNEELTKKKSQGDFIPLRLQAYEMPTIYKDVQIHDCTPKPERAGKI